MAIECNRCNGTGEIIYLTKLGIWKGHTCPDCNGTGYVTTIDERIKVYIFVIMGIATLGVLIYRYLCK